MQGCESWAELLTVDNSNRNPYTLLMITIQMIDERPTFGQRATMYVAHGPDGHTWLLKRTTSDAALRDGLAYFLATRTLVSGKWVLS